MFTAEDRELQKRLLEQEYPTSPKMVEFCLKNDKVVRLGDRIVDVCNLKPVIKSTMYYDDEKPAPDHGYQSFMNYNEGNFPRLFELDHLCYGKLYITPHYWRNKSGGKYCSVAYWWEAPEDGQEVTPDELVVINEAIMEVWVDYKNRLDRYFAKYQKHISSSGYWANR